MAVGVDLFGFEVVVEFVDLHLVHGGEDGVGGVGAFAVGDLLDRAAVGEEEERLIGLHVEGGVVVEALVEGSSGMVAGLSCCSNHFSGVRARTCSTSPGRGPKVKRLRSWRARSRAERDERSGFGWVCGLGLAGFFLGVQREAARRRTIRVLCAWMPLCA